MMLKSEALALVPRMPGCSNCDKGFRVFANARHSDQIRPLILPCGHLICDRCARYSSNCGRLTCGDCKMQIPLQSNRDIWSQFDVQTHLCGLAHLPPTSLPNAFQRPDALSARPNPFKQPKFRNCAECAIVQTELQCDHCSVPLCAACFAVLHATSRVLGQHQLVASQLSLLPVRQPVDVQPQMCKRHADQVAEFLCQKCSVMVCGTCRTERHDGHVVTVFSLENRKEQLRELNEKLQNVRCTILKAKELSDNTATARFKDDARKAMQSIFDHFVLLHTRLQVEERRAKLELTGRTQRICEEMLRIEAKLKSAEEKINESINCIENFGRELPKTMNLAAVIDDVNALYATLVSYGHCRETLQSVKLQEFPFVEFSVPPTKIKLQEASGRSNENAAKKSPVACQEQLVIVSHIKSPYNFFVQLPGVGESMEIICLNEATKAPRPSEVMVGSLYLVEELTKWYRAKVTANNGDDKFAVLFIDYGRPATVNSKTMLCMSDELAAHNVGVQECSLYSIRPPMNSIWAPEAKELMVEIIANKPVKMLCLGKNKKDISFVELISQRGSLVTFVRDALIAWQYAVPFRSYVTDSVRKELNKIRTRYQVDEQMRFNLAPMKRIDLVDVKVSNIVSPSEFYVSKTSDAKMYANLSKSLETFYNDQSAEQHMIFVPRAEIICAVLIDSTWHRGRLTGKVVSSERQCTVWLVDVGTTHTVGWGYIRELDESFRAMPEAVTCCTLAYVQPIAGNWSPDAFVAFRRSTKKAARIHVDLVENRNGVNQVILYEMLPNQQPICINQMLVVRGFANADSMLALRPKIDLDFVADDFETSDDLNVSTKVLPKDASVNETRTKVKLIHIASPGEFYVTAINHISGVDQMHHLVQQHMLANNEHVTTILEWQTGDLCLVKSQMFGDTVCWHRGRIMSVDAEGAKFCVFLCDRGIAVTVERHELVLTPEQFKSVSDGATRCHMAGVKPTNGFADWSATSIDVFRRVVQTFEALAVSIQGQRTDNSISVLLWGLTSDSTDPLQNTIHRWHRINKMLVMKGVAHLTESLESFDAASQPIQLAQVIQAAGSDTFDKWLSELNNSAKKAIRSATSASPSTPNNHSVSQSSSVEPIDESLTDRNFQEFWLPATPLDKAVFAACVTYVDDTGVLYMYDFQQKDVLTGIRVAVNEHCSQLGAAQLGAIDWTKNDACLAKYHLDGQYYRAVVHALANEEGEASVQFIDYGNIEPCPVDELIPPSVRLSRIPIQTRKYCLANLRPTQIGDAGRWPRKTIDFLHSHVVDKVANVNRVTDADANDGMSACRIVADGIGIHELLIEQKLATMDKEPTATTAVNHSSDTSDTETESDSEYDDDDEEADDCKNDVTDADLTLVGDFNVGFDADQSVFSTDKDTSTQSASEKETTSTQSASEKETTTTQSGLNNQSASNVLDTSKQRIKLSYAQYKALFDALEAPMLNALKNNSSDEEICSLNSQPAFGVSDQNGSTSPDVQQHSWPQNINTNGAASHNKHCVTEFPVSEESDGDCDEASDIATFDPFATSTRASSVSAKLAKHWSRQPPFSTFTSISMDKTSFDAQPMYLVDCLHIWLRPEDTAHEAQRAKLSHRLNKPNAKPPARVKPERIAPGLICLSRYTADSLYYRAMVKKYDGVLDEVTVVYVDWMNVEIVRAKDIRVCPAKVASMPLQILLVRFHGLQRHERWPDDSKVMVRFVQALQDSNEVLRVVVVKPADGDRVAEVELRDEQGLVYRDMITERYYNVVA